MILVKENNIFQKKRKNMLISFVLLSFVTLFFMGAADFQMDRFLLGFGKIPKVIGQYFPPRFLDFKLTLHELWITIVVSIGSTVVAAVFSFFMSLCVSEKISLNKSLGKIFNGVGIVCRNIPIYIWQLLLGMVFYMGGFFLAFLITFFVSLGFLIKTFKETIDESSGSSIEALEATGASKFVIIKNAVIPDTISRLVSWTLFCIETNMRSSSLIGYLTGAGFGHLISFYRGFKRDLNTTLGLVIIIAVVLILWDVLSNKLRGIILDEN